MSLSRCQFEILRLLEKNGAQVSNLRSLSDALKISASIIENDIELLSDSNLIKKDGSELSITDKGIESLEPYRVKRAVIMAAGFGSRMVPITLERPKPLVKINGVRIIDTLIDALVRAEVEEIIIVRGYKKEMFDELREKYPFITFADNDEFDTTNSISSIMRVIDKIDSCYLCEADLYISNPDVITKYQYCSNILGSYALQTDDWCFEVEGGYIRKFCKGNNYCYNEYGISYWTKEDSAKLREDYMKVYNEFEDGRNTFWDMVPLEIFKGRYNVEVRHCQMSDIVEIDTYHELQQLDPSYK